MKGKRVSTTLMVLLFASIILHASDGKSSFYNLMIINETPVTPIKDQYKSSTCWSFATLSLLESELMREGKGAYDLSEMFVVYNAYLAKAERYIRMHGHINLTSGGATNDALDVWKKKGMMPETAYSGLKNHPKHIHEELDAKIENLIKASFNDDKVVNLKWRADLKALLNEYLGPMPESFEYKGNAFNAQSFADSLYLNPDDYVIITSFTHQPYYKPFIMEVPDNWSWGLAYNLPLNELMESVKNALLNNYSFAWAADISEEGFSWAQGIAAVPVEGTVDSVLNTFESRKKPSRSYAVNKLYASNIPFQEIQISPELRQMAFDNYSTTDDHGMHVTGLAQNEHGKIFYKVKNSWGDGNAKDGYLFVTESYMQYKTISVLVNKNGLPLEVREKLGF